MKHEFWHEKWEADQLGFHQEQTHPLLEKYWPGLSLQQGSRVLVPLCGKSKDMLSIRQAGQTVVGAELSEIAVESFFAENGLPVEQAEIDEFKRYWTDDIELFCGDFFKLDKKKTGRLQAVFDRAALVALPPEMRQEYIDSLRKLLEPGVQILLITVEYESGQINPPPFTISQDEVRRLYGDWCDVSELGQAHALLKDISCLERAYKILVNDP